MDARCLECLVNRPRLDSTIRDQQQIILWHQEQDSIQGEKFSICEMESEKRAQRINALEREKKWFKRGLVIGAGIIIFETTLLLIK